MVNEKAKPHWGDWVLHRSQIVGIKRKRDLAAAIGCCHDQLSKWLRMCQPPTQMRKGFDCALIAALKTDRETLFYKFNAVNPSTAPIAELNEKRSDEAAELTRRRVLAMVELMPNDGLKELARVGEQILHKGMLQVA